MDKHKETIIPITVITLGIASWITGSFIGDRQGGKDIGMALVGGGVGYMSQQLTIKNKPED